MEPLTPPETSGLESLSRDDRIGYRFYEEPIKNLLAAIDQGTCPWHNPCLTLPIANASSGYSYRGVNRFHLALATMAHGYRSPYWLSLKQANDLGGRVKKGSRSTIVVFRKLFDRNRNAVDSEGGAASDPSADIQRPESFATENAPERWRTFTMLFYHRVFNYDQTEEADIGRDPYPSVQRTVAPEEAAEEARAILAGFKDGPEIHHTQSIVESQGGSYSERMDRIYLRPAQDYPSAGEYWSVVFHALIHACGAAKRLDFDRGGPSPKFGSREYALEELTCEIGSNLLLVRAGLENERLRSNAAAYLRSWKAKIEADPKLLIWAADRASRAVNLVLGLTLESNRRPEAAAESRPRPENGTSMPLPTASAMQEEFTKHTGPGIPAPAFEPTPG